MLPIFWHSRLGKFAIYILLPIDMFVYLYDYFWPFHLTFRISNFDPFSICLKISQLIWREIIRVRNMNFCTCTNTSILKIGKNVFFIRWLNLELGIKKKEIEIFETNLYTFFARLLPFLLIVSLNIGWVIIEKLKKVENWIYAYIYTVSF